jgi:hypothetical protein
MEARHVVGREPDAAVGRTAVAKVEAVVLERRPGEIRRGGRPREAADVEHDRAALQAVDVAVAIDERLGGGGNPDGADDGDLAAVGVERLGHGFAAIDGAPFGVGDVGQGPQQRARVAVLRQRRRAGERQGQAGCTDD